MQTPTGLALQATVHDASLRATGSACQRPKSGLLEVSFLILLVRFRWTDLRWRAVRFVET